VSLGLEFAGVVRSDGNHFSAAGSASRRHAPVQGREEHWPTLRRAVREDYLAELPTDSTSPRPRPAHRMETALTGLRQGRSTQRRQRPSPRATVGSASTPCRSRRRPAPRLTTVSGKSSRKRLAELAQPTSYYHATPPFRTGRRLRHRPLNLSARLRSAKCGRSWLTGVFSSTRTRSTTSPADAAQFSRKRIPLLFVPQFRARCSAGPGHGHISRVRPSSRRPTRCRRISRR